MKSLEIDLKFSHDYQRDINKMSLNTFMFDKENNLDFSIDKTIAISKKEMSKIDSELKELHKSPEHYKKIQERYEQSGSSLIEHEHHLLQDIHYLSSELQALLEVKIIYAFKHLEINLKNLIASAFNDLSAKKLYNWNDFVNYLSLKNIMLNQINYYKEVNHLRIVNNELKHSGRIRNTEINNIEEFKGKKEFTPADLENFYSRIKVFPSKFLNGLIIEINDNLYNFDEKKLTAIASKIALRMDHKTSNHLIEILKDLYKELL